MRSGFDTLARDDVVVGHRIGIEPVVAVARVAQHATAAIEAARAAHENTGVVEPRPMHALGGDALDLVTAHREGNADLAA